MLLMVTQITCKTLLIVTLCYTFVLFHVTHAFFLSNFILILFYFQDTFKEKTGGSYRLTNSFTFLGKENYKFLI
ncbi:hypothetical protein GLOIN_2v476869 [Rhizophagus irregularis DAOM 181602=DAOM 197198]|uniref:Uncharacterized protein n=1 Tax=Rhizophagus irregularis (strain DAOM 181602 / DAOM 197198 / MUCL 43194) TaxID=747089 RepID=A0A2P4QPH8_RHIID|nr:hypothetical protein GLOIN_2v476869 [Rhizophagus irregularis DAOM 181602=DAOM 197198]POG79553.1 hypothetical protein GLOIN_2v476869 [Rhizophagus irregularis DAOM 181602=DAOM 197198]GET57348.1 hypothetical protein GLOIN_2v476869 [Rhizophagus irregularis DAOM 181602=DAOM 197198]|eukprot:XP_025186419.1 hypothetical protein GLOIN_2v476869 [Rhizophagus irregularis DAOM 181602=DAOM 197198]